MSLKKLICGLCLLDALSCRYALALEWFPEFESLTEAEQSMVDGPWRLSPEYQSDVFTYTWPPSWTYPWLSHPKGLTLSAGSLSATEFMIEDRLKVHHFLTESLEFRFTYFEEKNLERELSHRVLELIYWPRAWIGLSAYGEPELYKRNDDTGLALLLKPSERHEIRLFNTFVDVTRLKRNNLSDTYVEPYLPYSRGIVGRWWEPPVEGSGETQGDFLEYAIRYETETRWLFPDLGYQYGYWKSLLSFQLGKNLGPGLRFYTRLQFDRKRESRVAISPDGQPPAAVQPFSWLTDRLFVAASAEVARIGPWRNWDLLPGIEFAARRWNTDQGPATYRDLLPNLALRMPAFGSGLTRDTVEVGIDLDWHRSSGAREYFATEEEDGAVNSRLNLVYEFRFANDASIRLQATGDLDRFGTRQTWEGGNGQLKLFF